MNNIYNISYEESQEYISQRGFDTPWNDGEVFVDEREITRTVGNVLKWADEHPKEGLVSMDKLEEWLYKYFVIDHYGMSPAGFGVFMHFLKKGMEE